MPRQNKNKIRLNVESLEARRLLSVFADFNGDGRDDMAVGIPFEDLGTVEDAGAVLVVYGTATGLNSTGSQVWTQDVPNVPDTGEAGDKFGDALAGGDFNGDGFADLAIGVPNESIGAGQTGAVNIIYGSAIGLLATATDKLWHQDSPRVREINETGDHFGNALAAGDFNGDGLTDLAVGVPNEDLGVNNSAGTMAVFYGGPGGISAVGNQNIHLDSGLLGEGQANANFGTTLSSGDFNGDGRDDLSIGIPSFDVGFESNAGSVSVVYGSASGITAAGSQFWNQDSTGITGGAESVDQFGSAVAAGDFNGDGRSDLAIGVEGEGLGAIGEYEGFVHVLYGTASGITATGSDAFSQSDVGGTSEINDFFGGALAAADFNGDGRHDLAVGARFENLGLNISAGVVHVVFGSAAGINVASGIEIRQEDVGVGEQSETEDIFGYALGTGDFNGNGKADLAMAAPGQNIGTEDDAGRVLVMYGTTSGALTGGQAWDEGSPGISGGIEPGDFFGGGLDSGGGKSVPGGGRHHLARLITADFGTESALTTLNKRRFLGRRR